MKSDLADLPPRGIAWETTSSGRNVQVSDGQIALFDRRVWIATLLKISVVAAMVGTLAVTRGAGHAQLRYLPLIAYLAVVTGLFSFIRMRRRLTGRVSPPASLTLVGARLTINEWRIQFAPGGRTVTRVPSETVYELANVEYFAFGDVTDAPLFQRALEVHSIDGSVRYHLRDYGADQLRWVCNWLSMSLRQALQ